MTRRLGGAPFSRSTQKICLELILQLTESPRIVVGSSSVAKTTSDLDFILRSELLRRLLQCAPVVEAKKCGKCQQPSRNMAPMRVN